MTITRRKMCILLPGLLPAAAALDAFAEADPSLPSANYPYDKLPVQTLDHAEMRRVLKGKLATGEALEVHETTLPPGGAPHAPHYDVHSEMWLIREGTVELMVNGTGYRLGPDRWDLFIRMTSMELGLPVTACADNSYCCRGATACQASVADYRGLRSKVKP